MNRLYPNDAPFVAGVVPTGWDAAMTQAEADEANLLYPVPPYGNTYWDPGNEPPVDNPELAFVELSSIVSDGNSTEATLRPGDAAKLAGHDTLTIWPIAGRAGILDDLPARAVRVQALTGDNIRVNLDTDGLNLTGLKFLGVIKNAE